MEEQCKYTAQQS